jgi:hypothetical protein
MKRERGMAVDVDVWEMAAECARAVEASEDATRRAVLATLQKLWIELGMPLRIPYGNKEVALKLGARYGSAGWYAPPGVDLSAFGERGWL